MKVEIQGHQKLVAQMKQDPQNADLKKQLHEQQARITALSEKQKKVVEQLRKDLMIKQDQMDNKVHLQQSLQFENKALTHLQQQVPTPPPLQQQPQSAPPSSPNLNIPQQKTVTSPMFTTKALPLALLKATTTVSTAVVTPRPTIAMVTTMSSNQKTVIATDTQNAPINLQTPKITTHGTDAVRILAKNTVALVRPKTVPQTNIPIAPAPPSMLAAAAPQLIQRPVMLTTKFTPTSLTSPTNSIHPVRIVNGQPTTIAKTFSTAQLTGIVIATPGTRLAPPQTLQLSKPNFENKTLKSPVEAEEKQTESPASPHLPKSKREETPQKLAFMVSLGLVTHDHLEEIQSKRQERKRRTTANPVYSGAVFEPERKKSAVTYLNSTVHPGTRKRGRPPKYNTVLGIGALTPTSPPPSHPASPENEKKTSVFSFPVAPQGVSLPSPSSADQGDIHEDFCSICRKSGQLLMCDTCSRVYHLDCLEPPLKTIPKGMWICPKCQDQIQKKEEAIPWPGTLAIVHSYIAYKAAKEEEKQKLLKWSADLKQEREQLEQKVRHLSNSITHCMEMKNTILARQKEMHSSLEKVKRLIRLIQGIDLSKPTSTEGTLPTDSCSTDCVNSSSNVIITTSSTTSATLVSSPSCMVNCSSGLETK